MEVPVRFARSAGREGTFLLLSLLVLSFRGIWQEVYSWGAAYVNYLTPMALLLLLPPLLRGDGRRRPWSRRALLAGLSFAGCLFMETVTIFLLLGSLIAVGVLLKTDRPAVEGGGRPAAGERPGYGRHVFRSRLQRGQL